MNFTLLYRKLLLSGFFLFLLTTALFGQTTTTSVTGTVTDAVTKKPLSFVTVGFLGTSIGGPTNDDGKFSISTTQNVKQIKLTFLGYKDALLPIKSGQAQVINA